MRYLFTFERADGRTTPFIMEGTSPQDALMAIIKSHPYLDERDYVRYTVVEVRNPADRKED